jgi:cytochrome P450
LHQANDLISTFEPAYLGLALSPFKPLTAAKAYRAREFLVSAWRDYITAKGPEEASAFINVTHAHNASHGFCLDDLARFEVGHSFAIIASTAPTAWWLMYHIFSDEDVLKDVRGELSALVEVTDDGKSRIDLASVRDSCPILLSTFKETMRYRAIGNAVRVCLEDTWLEDRVLLKKGSAVIMPQVVFHTEEAAWGPDSHVFDHLRFVRGHGRRRPNPVAFRAFGGGHNLCPGRHFSSTEILASAALLVLLFDVTPKSGKWVEPTWDKTPMVFSFQLPDEDIDADVQPRDDREWEIVFSGSNSAMSIVSEDMKAE